MNMKTIRHAAFAAGLALLAATAWAQDLNAIRKNLMQRLKECL